MKKILLGLGATIATIAPMAVVVACSFGDNESKTSLKEAKSSYEKANLAVIEAERAIANDPKTNDAEKGKINKKIYTAQTLTAEALTDAAVAAASSKDGSSEETEAKALVIKAKALDDKSQKLILV